MANYQWVMAPPRLKDFLGRIPKMGVPDKVTNKYLEQTGFKSKNDRGMISVLKGLGFLDGSGQPTATWRAYRQTDKSKAIMAQAVRTKYADLYNTFPDAHRKDTEALRNFFSVHSTGGNRTLNGIVQTFKALAELADFEAEPIMSLSDPPPKDPPPKDPPPLGLGSGVTVNLNIQIGLPDTDKPELYDKFFEALRKHLLS